jgi:minor histocompatibility antigen H13
MLGLAMYGLLACLPACRYIAKKHWFANNMLGIAFSLEAIEHLNLGSVQVD